MQHAALGDGLEGRPPQHAVHALAQEVAVAQLRPHVKRKLLQVTVVGIGHAGETNTKPEREREREREREKRKGVSYQ